MKPKNSKGRVSVSFKHMDENFYSYNRWRRGFDVVSGGRWWWCFDVVDGDDRRRGCFDVVDDVGISSLRVHEMS